MIDRIPPRLRCCDKTLPGQDSPGCCLDSGAKKVLIPSVSTTAFAAVPTDLMGAFHLIHYNSTEDAVFKAPGVE